MSPTRPTSVVARTNRRQRLQTPAPPSSHARLEQEYQNRLVNPKPPEELTTLERISYTTPQAFAAVPQEQAVVPQNYTLAGRERQEAEADINLMMSLRSETIIPS